MIQIWCFRTLLIDWLLKGGPCAGDVNGARDRKFHFSATAWLEPGGFSGARIPFIGGGCKLRLGAAGGEAGVGKKRRQREGRRMLEVQSPNPLSPSKPLDLDQRLRVGGP